MATQQGGKFVLAALLFTLAVLGIGAAMMYYGKGMTAFSGGIVVFFGLGLLYSWYKMAVTKAVSAVVSRRPSQARF